MKNATAKVIAVNRKYICGWALPTKIGGMIYQSNN